AGYRLHVLKSIELSNLCQVVFEKVGSASAARVLCCLRTGTGTQGPGEGDRPARSQHCRESCGRRRTEPPPLLSSGSGQGTGGTSRRECTAGGVREVGESGRLPATVVGRQQSVKGAGTQNERMAAERPAQNGNANEAGQEPIRQGGQR